MAVTFDAKKDYQAAINAETAKGKAANQNVINQLSAERSAKIASNPSAYGAQAAPLKDIADGTMKVSNPVAEVLYAKEQYAKAQAAGNTAGANAANTYANTIRTATGLDANKYGAGVTSDQVRANVAQALNGTGTGTSTGVTGTKVGIEGIPKVATGEEVLDPKLDAFKEFIPNKPGLRGIGDLSALYGGITYDEGAIKAKFDAATKGEYDMLGKQYDMTENKFYDKLYGMQGTALDTIRKSNAASVATGASRGMQAANELSAILGLEQQGTAEATTLAQERNLLKDKEAAAYTKNVVDAMTYADKAKMGLAGLSGNLYATDTQFDVGQMDYYARLDTAVKNLEGMIKQADATKYTADQNLTGNKYTADQNLGGVQYTADKNLQGNQYTADQNRAANQYTADKNYSGTAYNADKNLAGTQYVADKNYSGTVYNADQNLAGTKASVQGQKEAAAISAQGQRDAASIGAAGQKAAAAISAAGYNSGTGKNASPDMADALAKYVNNGDYKTYTAVMSAAGVKPESIKSTWDDARLAYKAAMQKQGRLNQVRMAEGDKPAGGLPTEKPSLMDQILDKFNTNAPVKPRSTGISIFNLGR